MYNNDTPIDGQVSSTRGNLVKVSKSNPCPHCGKPDWCYFIGELSVCNRDQPPATGWEVTSKTDKDGKIYYARPQEKKPVRPAQTRYWEYPARDGSPLVRVRRIDFGDGRKKDIKQQHWDNNKKAWVAGYGSATRDSIPIYRYAEVREAIANGKQILLVDGEQCADILWEFNLAATTSIGGMGKFSFLNSRDLEGAQVVIVPDRDEPGTKDADKAAEYFPDAKWLYPFPEKDWEHLPKSDGLDIFDWIRQGNFSPSDIRAAIGEKKIFEIPQAAPNVIRPPQFQVPHISELGAEIEALLNSDLKKSQLQTRISELTQKFRITSADVWKIYREREQELEQEASQEDTRIGIEQLLASQVASVKLSEIFPESLATPIEVVATRMNLKPECYALALISGVSRFLKNGSSTMLVEEWNRYRCRTHGYFGAMIAEASQMKTPVLNAMIADPLAAMRENNQKKFETQKKAYEVELENWKLSKDQDKGPAPDAPVEKFAYITKATWEGIAGMVSRNPTQGILWLCDELAGFFNSANQYRSGKGSDKEDLLECWSGNGAVIARAAGTTVNVGAVSLSLYGNIQPKVLAPFLGDGSDDNGTFARFDFVQQPPALTQITLGLSKIDINPMLQALYERVDAIPVTEFALDEEAKKLFVDYYNHCQRLRLNHPKQGMRAMLGKAAEKVGRVATILHCIHAAHLGGEVSPKIPASRVRAAIKWVEYTTQQALSINIEVCSPDALESNLAKIISLAERNEGTVTARDVLRIFGSKYRPTSQTVREWFGDLEALKYGKVTEKGRSVCFSLDKTSALTAFAESPDGVSIPNAVLERGASALTAFSTQEYEINADETRTKRGRNADENRVLKPSADKDFNSNAVNADVFTHSPETSHPSMLSHTTEPIDFPDEHQAKILADQMRKAIAKSSYEDAREVMGQMNSSSPQVRALFVKSFSKEESLNIRLLKHCGLTQGAQVNYVGKDIEQYVGEVLTLESINARNELACLRPDGKGYTTWLKPEDLRKL
jgi:CRISPR-associated protein Cmr3